MLCQVEELAVYRLLTVPGLTGSTVRGILGRWRDDPEAAAGFWTCSPEAYRERWGLPERAIQCLMQAGAGHEERARVLALSDQTAEIELLSLLDGSYEELASRRGLPGVLFTRGNQDLLWAPSAAVLHSRDASDRGLAWGSAVAQALARMRVTMVSSQNREAYRLVAAASKRHAAPLVLVLDRSLHGLPAEGPMAEPVSTSRLWDDRFRSERELVLSAVPPHETWRPRHAKERDGLIVRVAAVLIVGDVRPGGNMARQCLGASAGGTRVFQSPFCRAGLDGEQLPEDPEAAALCIVAAIDALKSDDQNVTPGVPGWLTRRWTREIESFVRALPNEADPRWWSERKSVHCDGGAESLARRGWQRSGLRALIMIPEVPQGDRAVLVAVGDRRVAEGADRPPVLVMAPQGAVSSPAELRRYLSECRCRLAAELRDPPR